VAGCVLHVIDDSCTPEAMLELSALLRDGEEVISAGPPPEWLHLGRDVPRLPRPNRRAVRQADGIARRYDRAAAGKDLVQCWSVGAAVAFWSGVSYASLPLAIRLTELPGRSELGRLLEMSELAWPEVVCAAEADAAELRAAAGRLAVRVIPPVAVQVPREPGARSAARRRLGVCPGEFALLAAGTVRRDSGHRMAVWAADILNVAGVPVRLLVHAAGPALGGLEGFVSRIRFGSRVVFVGPEVPVPELLAAADVVLLLQRRCLPAVLLACAAGAAVPVVAGRQAGQRRGLTDDQDALLVAGDDPRAIAGALLRLVEQPELGARLGRSARRGAGSPHEVGFIRRRWAELHGRCGQVEPGPAAGL